MFQVQFQPTAELIRTGVRLFWRKHYLSTRELFITLLFLFGLGAFIVIRGMEFWSAALIYGLINMSFWLVRFKVYRILLRKKLEAWGQYPGRTMTMPVQLAFSEAGVQQTQGDKVLVWEWQRLSRIIESKKVWLLCWGKADFLILPTENADEAIFSELRNKLPRR